MLPVPTRQAIPVDDPSFASSFPYRDGPDSPFLNRLTDDQTQYLIAEMRKLKDNRLSTSGPYFFETRLINP